MNEVKAYNAVTKIDDDLLDRCIKRKPHKRSVAVAVSAAAVLAVVLGVILLPALFGKQPINPTIKDITKSPYPASAPVYYGDQNSLGESGNGQVELNSSGLSVTAKLIETLPDIYTFFDDWRQNEYRILRFSTVKLLKGAEMTDEFYYLIPVGFMTDFSVFDQFVILDMAQFGYEYSVLYNKTQEKAEQLNLVLFGYRVYGFDLMGENFIAFDENGRFDERLWNANDLWKKGTERVRIPVHISETEEEVQNNSQEEPHLYVHLLEDISGDAAKVLSEIKSFETGIFVPVFSSNIMRLSPEVQFHAVRYLNGFPSNEKISIWCKEWTGGETDTFAKTKAHFSENDLQTLPDLASAVVTVARAFDNGDIVPPHISKPTALKLASYGIFGWYAKTDGGVIGVVRVTWRFQSGELDDAYYYVDAASAGIVSIDRDALLKKIGEYEKSYIFEGDYNKNGKVLGDLFQISFY